jgi:ribosomal 50S subunit-associated protein YjgA (DUF615 family)
MSINKVSASEAQTRLMQYIGGVIQQVTMTSPMSVEDIVSVLGVCCGAAIANGKSVMSRRELRQMVLANLDNAMQTADQMPKSAIIMPPGQG